MSLAPGREYRVEPLSAIHNRAAFHSGIPELDNHLHHQAGQDARRKVAVMAGRKKAKISRHLCAARYDILLTHQ